MRTIVVLLALAVSGAGLAVAEPVRVLTTLPDFREIAREVGGARVDARSLLAGPEDPHFIDAKPSFIRQAHDADLFILVGLELEVGYVPLILQNSRNARIQPGQAGHLEVAEVVPLLGIPAGPVDRSMGDVHAGGNPHFWLDPANWTRIAEAIAARLKRIDAAGAAEYEAGLAAFRRKVNDRLAVWSERLAHHRGTPVVTFHDDMPYLAARFGLETIATLEPKPGVSPTPAHLAQVILRMRERKSGMILTTGFAPRKIPEMVAEKTGARVVLVAHMVGAVPEAQDLWSTVDFNVAALLGGSR